MSCSSSSSAWTRLPCHAVLVACIASFALASSADARIGNPLKKVKEKIGKAAEQKAPPQASADEQVVFDEQTVELTDERVERILDAFKKAGDVAAGRAALVEKQNKANDERRKITDKHERAIAALRNKRDEVLNCYQAGYRAAQERRAKEYSEKALTDPVIREKFSRVAQENNAAAAKGDSAAIQRINAVLLAETSATSDDSLKVRQSCGTVPPRSAEEDQLDALDKQIASLDEQIRKIDDKVAAAQAEKGGLTEEQWGTALERIHGYMGWADSHKPRAGKGSGSGSGSASGSGSGSGSGAVSGPRGYTDEELKALEKHLEQLRAALG